jgi:cystathionine beta-lyase
VVELLRALIRPGDAVAISPPVYPPFFDWLPEAGARLLEVPLAHQPDGWRLDLDALARAFATHPAAYVLCNPQNPVGRVHTATELAALVRLARIYRVTLISDEIHGPLVLPGATFTPLLAVPGAAEVAVTVMSASKAWNLAGLKCAAVVGWHPPEATFLAWLDCSAIGPDDTARAQFLDRGRVALEPGLRFGAIGSGYARLNFATSETILDEAVTRMAAALDC